VGKFGANGTRVEIRKLVKTCTKVSVDIWISSRMQYRRDKVALRTICIKNVKFKIIKITTGCQYMGYSLYSEDLNWTAQNLRLRRMRPSGRGWDTADWKQSFIVKSCSMLFFVHAGLSSTR